VKYYLEHAKTLVRDVGYIPLPDEIYSLAMQRYEKRIVGSVFKGGGPQVGVTLADLLKAEQ
jgi:phosphate transport system substrate-binding protein